MCRVHSSHRVVCTPSPYLTRLRYMNTQYGVCKVSKLSHSQEETYMNT